MAFSLCHLSLWCVASSAGPWDPQAPANIWHTLSVLTFKPPLLGLRWREGFLAFAQEGVGGSGWWAVCCQFPLLRSYLPCFWPLTLLKEAGMWLFNIPQRTLESFLLEVMIDISYFSSEGDEIALLFFPQPFFRALCGTVERIGWANLQSVT